MDGVALTPSRSEFAEVPLASTTCGGSGAGTVPQRGPECLSRQSSPSGRSCRRSGAAARSHTNAAAPTIRNTTSFRIVVTASAVERSPCQIAAHVRLNLTQGRTCSAAARLPSSAARNRASRLLYPSHVVLIDPDSRSLPRMRGHGSAVRCGIQSLDCRSALWALPEQVDGSGT